MTPRQETQLCFEFDGRDPAAVAESETPPGRSRLEQLLLNSYLNNLASSSWRARKKGAKGLGRLGPAASVAVPALEKLLSDPDPRVRAAARETLRNIERATE